MSTIVADLAAKLGLQVNAKQWGQGDKAISGIKTALAGVGAYFGGKFLGKALIGFNSNVEDTKTQIAGMLALTKKTNLSDEIGNADMLMGNLQKRAASLPGTTQEYAQMLGMLTQPIMAAGGSMQDLEDLTVNSVVAAKGLGVEWDVAARDIDQALRGQFKSTDQFTGKLLASFGFAGEEGRSKFNKLSKEKRAAVVKEALTQKQIVQLGEAQGKSFSGVMSTLQDAVQQFLGRVGIPLFKALGEIMQRMTAWLSANESSIQAVAKAIGEVLADAFAVVIEVIKFFIDNAELTKSIFIALGIILVATAIKAAAAWVLAALPLIAIVAVLTAIVLGVRALIKPFGSVRRAATEMWKSIKKSAMDFLDTVVGTPGAILDAFVGIGEAIIAAFGNAFDWIEKKAKELPRKIPILGPTGQWLGESAAKVVLRVQGDQTPDIDATRVGGDPARPGATGGGVNMSAEFNISSPNADPAMVADEAQKAFSKFWDTQMTQTHEAL